MFRVLVIGYAPEAVDFSDPALPSDMNKEKVAEGIKEDMLKLHERGWHAYHLPILADDQIRQTILDHLQDNAYDVVVLGAGLRLTNERERELETVVNTLREGAPQTPIAFNSGPDKSDEAAARWLKS